MTDRHILLANVFFAPFTYGGATIVAEQVAKALRDLGGYKITAVSMCARADLQTYTMIRTQQDGITNYVINVPHGRKYQEIYENPQVTDLLDDVLQTVAPDVVHAHCIQDMGTGIIERAKAHDIPTILSVHDFWWVCERQFMVRPDQTYCGQNPIDITACRGCVNDMDAAQTRFEHLRAIGTLPDLVTYPSRFAKDLCTASGFAPDTGVVWENGVRLPGPDFAARQAARRARDPRLTFGFVGGPSQIKGWPLIKKAFKSLDRDDFRVCLVDGSPDGSWWRDASFDDIPGDWQVLPRFDQDGMDDYYCEIDTLLFMSQWKETFGLALREALTRGVAVIQTDSGGTTEHGAVPADDLIPIGAPPSVLAARLNAALDAHPQTPAPHPVQSYDEQARAFSTLLDGVLGAAP